ncbi:hypothetical protein Pfo_021122 [Paulownia fortunei]|nr:hypothetical protein Pfo_021122 [Paulownia fortunei]
MCIKLSKTLNPEAEEWRPTPQQPPLQPHQLLPHVIFPPHSQPLAAPLPPQQAVQVVAFTPTPTQKLLSQLPDQQSYYYSHPRPRYQGLIPYNYNVCTQRQPFYYASFPADGHFYKAAKAAKSISVDETKDLGCGNEMNLQEKNIKSYKEKKVEIPRGRCPKSPPVDVFKKGTRRVFPPRLRRVVRCFSVENKPPPKQEWRPRKSAKPEYKFSGDGGASHSPPPILPLPPPSSCDDSSHPSNTTVMIKNIPNQLRRDFMLKFLDDYCKAYSLEYDFLYLPMDFRKKNNLGYAFANFTTAGAAFKFKKILQNFKWEMVYTDGRPITSKKICEITWARVQGKEALIKKFEHSSFTCDRLDFLPVVLDPPRNGSDPNPSPPVILGTLHRPALS